MRIIVKAGTPERLDATVRQFLSTNISVNSRLLDWFARQDEWIQSAVLGLLRPDTHVDVPRRALEATRGGRNS